MCGFFKIAANVTRMGTHLEILKFTVHWLHISSNKGIMPSIYLQHEIYHRNIKCNEIQWLQILHTPTSPNPPLPVLASRFMGAHLAHLLGQRAIGRKHFHSKTLLD